MVTNNPIQTWCKNCQNFHIHNWQNENLICNICDIKYTEYLYSEIPEDKLQEQRKKYSNQKRQNFNRMFNPLDYLGFNPMGSSAQTSENLIQDNAGQKQIDENKKIEKQKLIDRYNQIKDDYNLNYSKLNRNDECSCGSGIKYKKCHYLYFQKLQII